MIGKAMEKIDTSLNIVVDDPLDSAIKLNADLSNIDMCMCFHVACNL